MTNTYVKQSNNHFQHAQTMETVLSYENIGKTKDSNDLNNDSQNSNGSVMEEVVKEVNCRLVQEEITEAKKELEELEKPTPFKSMVQMG